MNKQRGGTLLGVILGVVIGLGVALGVAVYVTKVPVPFVNKASSRTVLLDGCSHMPLMERPVETAAALEEFLQ